MLSLIELKQIKADLGSYSDNSDGFIDASQHITLVYDLTSPMWKDPMIILGQTLLDTKQERNLQEARKYANGLHLSNPKYPIGETAVPLP